MLVNRIGWLVCVVYATIPVVLAGHSSARSILAIAASFALSRSGTVLGRDVVRSSVSSARRGATCCFTGPPGAGCRRYSFSAADCGSTGGPARVSVPRQLGGLPEVMSGHHEQRLATSGIRAHVRHPVYLGHLCEMMAWSVGTGLLVCYVLTVFAVISGAIMVRLEDRELEQRFGEDYRAYRQRVPAILPRI